LGELGDGGVLRSECSICSVEGDVFNGAVYGIRPVLCRGTQVAADDKRVWIRDEKFASLVKDEVINRSIEARQCVCK
jgi:hypothetical protein